jgi:DNA-directed RNA polymerase specialized sigma24 family protein
VVAAANKTELRRNERDESTWFVDDKAIDEEILMAERNAGLRAGFAELPARCQQLLSMLISDPPSSYASIHDALGIPVGSIGPQRARCLDRLRRSNAFLALGENETAGKVLGR